jgi:hypothetical protein
MLNGCSVVGELIRRFEHAQKSGDDGPIPPSLSSVIYSTVRAAPLFRVLARGRYRSYNSEEGKVSMPSKKSWITVKIPAFGGTACKLSSTHLAVSSFRQLNLIHSTALGASSDLDLLDGTLKMICKDDSIIGDLLIIFPSLVTNGHGSLAAEFFKAHVDEVRFPR